MAGGLIETSDHAQVRRVRDGWTFFVGVATFAGYDDVRIAVRRRVHQVEILGLATHMSPGAVYVFCTGDAASTPLLHTPIREEEVRVLARFLPVVAGPWVPDFLPKYLWPFVGDYCELAGLELPHHFKPEWMGLDREARDAWARAHAPESK